MADMLLGDIKNAIAELEKLDYPTPTLWRWDKVSYLSPAGRIGKKPYYLQSQIDAIK